MVMFGIVNIIIDFMVVCLKNNEEKMYDKI